MLELLSRIRALLRRNEPVKLQQSGLVIDMERMTVLNNGEVIYITPTEFKILSALMRNANQILTRSQLLETIWDVDEQFIDDNTLSVHVRRLREKIGAERIRTIRGVGYKWEEST
jgi:DNA-binding response OmpR family regulator